MSEPYAGRAAWLEGDFKLVRGSKGELELYDLGDDPLEKVNLVGSNEALVKKLNGKLTDWQDSVVDSLLGKDYE